MSYVEYNKLNVEAKEKEKAINKAIKVAYVIGGSDLVIEQMLKDWIANENIITFPDFAYCVKRALLELNVSDEDIIKYNALVKVGLEKIEKELIIDYKKTGEDE